MNNNGKVSSRLITNALKAAFKRTDRQYMAKVSGAFELGFGRDTRAGSCAIAVFIIDGVIFCANAGDSRALTVTSIKESNKTLEKLNSKKERLFEILKSRRQPNKVENYNKNLDNPKLAIELQDKIAELALHKSLGYPCEEEDEQILRKKLFNALRKSDQLDKDIENSELSLPRAALSSFLSFFGSKATTDGFSDERAKLLIPDLASLDITKHMTVKRISNDHNAKYQSEQEKLRRKHPLEKDIVVCKNKNSCYVKGRLQPTRALGDFHLKFSEFKLQRNTEENIPFTPPYISCTPEVIVHPIVKEDTKVDEFLILATDGLWDYLSDVQVAELVLRWVRIEGLSLKEASSRLINQALEASAEKYGHTLEELKGLKPGRQRRSKHDDISVIIVDLGQVLDMFYFG